MGHTASFSIILAHQFRNHLPNTLQNLPIAFAPACRVACTCCSLITASKKSTATASSTSTLSTPSFHSKVHSPAEIHLLSLPPLSLHRWPVWPAKGTSHNVTMLRFLHPKRPDTTDSEDFGSLQVTIEAIDRKLNGVETCIHFPSCLEPVPENWWPVHSQPHDQLLNLPS